MVFLVGFFFSPLYFYTLVNFITHRFFLLFPSAPYGLDFSTVFPAGFLCIIQKTNQVVSFKGKDINQDRWEAFNQGWEKKTTFAWQLSLCVGLAYRFKSGFGLKLSVRGQGFITMFSIGENSNSLGCDLHQHQAN